MRNRRHRRNAPSAARLAAVLSLVVGTVGVGLVDVPRARASGVAAASTSVGRSSVRTAITLQRPAGTAVGDVLLASVASGGTGAALSAPPGWTKVREDAVGQAVRQGIYYRVATPSEPESYVWSLRGNGRLAGGITAYAGVNGAHPVDAHDALVHGGQGMAVTAPSITTTMPRTVLVHFAAVATEATLAPPAGMIERWEAGSDNPGRAGDLVVSSSESEQAQPGTTGTRTVTASRPGAGIGAAVALRPARATQAVAASAETVLTATAVEVVAVGSAWSESTDGRSSVIVNRPVGTQPGHVMVATVVINGAPSGIVTPEGWTRIREDRAGNAVGQAVFVRAAAASDAASYTFSVSGRPQVAAGITAYSGVETSAPVEAHDAMSGSGASVTAPSLVAGSAGARLLHLVAANVDGMVNPPTGMTERFEANSPHPKNNKDVLVALADEMVAAPGATGTRTATLSPAGTAIGAALILRPAGSLPPPPPPDTTAPETTIDSGPPPLSGSSFATFSFSADEAVLMFRCQLDGGLADQCSSPRTYSGLANGAHTFSVVAVDLAGNIDGSPATWTWTVELPVSDGTVLVGAGDIASCANDNDEATARLIDGVVAQHPEAIVFTSGDNVYDNGTAAEFRDCYAPTWGRHRPRTRPAPGNHEYGTAGAAGYFGYFGAAAGSPGQGYYDYVAGDWHVVVLNSQCNAIGGCHAGSAQEQWLRARLAEVSAECTVAMWHHPRFSSGSVHGATLAVSPLWQALYEHGAELIVNGHEHVYERFAPQTPDGALDDVYGVRQITNGLGGRSRYGFNLVSPNSLFRFSADYGVLKLTLRSGAYDFEMLRVGGGQVLDSGTGGCHGAPPTAPPPPPPPPPVPGTIDAVASSSSGASTAQPALTVARPAGVVAGHVMVANVVANDNDPGFTAPAGWTPVTDLTAGGVLRQGVYYKVATASEPTSYTWVLETATTRRITGGVTAYVGVDTAHPVEAHGAAVQTEPSTAVAAPSVTTTVGDTRLIHLAAVNAEGSISPPAGMTERWQSSSPNPKNERDALAAMADMGLAEAGATGVRVAVATQPGPNIAVALALRPASSEP